MRPISRAVLAMITATAAFRAGALSASADRGPYATFLNQMETVRCAATARHS